MVLRHPDIWKWFLFIAIGLILVAKLAPISASLESILSDVAFVALVAFSLGYFWQEQRARQADQSSSDAISSNDQM